ncbi:MAG TPA: DUF3859 domain-containing protein [Verrucomicrobiae bacterium]|jgi:hypothetical protein|nr:DUF3859 domain-containing protein [Verrucomicrobiae bacterium]
MKLIFQLFIACVFSFSLLGQEVQVTGAKVTEYGIYTAQVRKTDINSAGLKLQGLDNFVLLTSTTNVPARVGIRFGFRYEILGEPTNAPIVLTMILTHPPIKNALTARLETRDVYQTQSWIGKTYTCNSLDSKSDLVPGLWTFEVWYTTNKLCTQNFLVVPDDGTQ